MSYTCSTKGGRASGFSLVPLGSHTANSFKMNGGGVRGFSHVYAKQTMGRWLKPLRFCDKVLLGRGRGKAGCCWKKRWNIKVVNTWGGTCSEAMDARVSKVLWYIMWKGRFRML